MIMIVVVVDLFDIVDLLIELVPEIVIVPVIVTKAENVANQL